MVGFADGMQGGMQMGLGLFNAMQSASYQQQMMQQADENQALRREDQALKKQQVAAQQFQQKFDRNKFIIDNSSKLGTDMVIEAYNDLNAQIGGPNARKISALDIETFKTNSTSALNNVKGAATDEEANRIITDYRAQAATHPIMNEIGNFQVKLMEDARARRDVIKQLEVLGVGNSQWREKYVGDGDPNTIRKMVADNDQLGMMKTQWAQDTLLRHENGEKVAPADLANAIAWNHTKLGGELKGAGKTIFEPMNRAQMHLEAQNGLKEAQNELSPILRTTDLIKPEDVKALNDASTDIKTVAGRYDADRGVFDALGLGAVKHTSDALSQSKQVLEKYPQIKQQLQQIGPKADEQTYTIKQQLQQLERDKVAATAAVTLPNRTEHLERLDRQIALKKEQLTPWETVANAYHDPDSPVAIKKLLNINGNLNKSLKQHEKLRTENLTEGEKNAKKHTDLEFNKYHREVGTAMVGAELMKEINANPGMTDQQILGRAGELSQAYHKQRGYMPDPNEVTKRLVAARTKAEDTTVTKLTPEQGFKFETAVTGAENTRSLIKELFPGGKLDRGALATAFAGGLPFTGGRNIQAYIKDALDAEYRARTGAAMPDSEWERAKDTFVPGQADNDKTAETKLTNLLRHFENKLNLVDPDSKLRGRVKPVTTVEDVAKGQSGQQSFDDFKTFWKQNKDKYNGDMDKAASEYRQGNQ